MRVRWLAAWVCKSAGLGAELLLDGGTRAGRGYVGFVAVVVPPDTARHTQMTVTGQPRDGGGCMGGGSV